MRKLVAEFWPTELRTRSMRRLLLTVCLLLMPTIVFAGQIVLGRCHMGACYWYDIKKKSTVVSHQDGRLVRFSFSECDTLYRNTNLNPKRPRSCGNSTDESFFFCSPTRPALVEYVSAKKVRVMWLAPGSDIASYGVNERIHNLYAAVCHNLTHEVDVSSERFAKKYGYTKTFDNTTMDEAEFNSLEDFLNKRQ